MNALRAVGDAPEKGEHQGEKEEGEEPEPEAGMTQEDPDRDDIGRHHREEDLDSVQKDVLVLHHLFDDISLGHDGGPYST